jgi:predicted nucleic acid-binding protein
MKVVVDASLAIAWFVEETATTTARQLAASAHDLLAPDCLLAELADALVTCRWRGLVPEGFVAQAIATLQGGRAIALAETPGLLAPAAILAETLAHPVHDCLYLALAQREAASLATFDTRLAALAHRLAIPLWSPGPAP